MFCRCRAALLPGFAVRRCGALCVFAFRLLICAVRAAFWLRARLLLSLRLPPSALALLFRYAVQLPLQLGLAIQRFLLGPFVLCPAILSAPGMGAAMGSVPS